MRRLHLPIAFLSATTCVLLSCSAALSAKEQPAANPPAQEAAGSAAAAPAPNTLTEAQKKAGWKLLFDGKTTAGWRGYRREAFPPKGWVVEDGTLHVLPAGGGGDVMTVDKYGDFDLRLEFKVSKKANSGIMYLVSEDEKASWQSGPEYQILDDLGYGIDPTDAHSAGSLYDLYRPRAGKPVRPAGKWNEARIVIRRGKVEHWLNGMELLECDLASADWKARLAKSKFAVYKHFGRNASGYIALQDHGHELWFRNMRIRNLNPKAGRREIPLFNGRDLAGWTVFPSGEGQGEPTWRVEKGVLLCSGSPRGYISTNKAYGDFILRLEWRFDPVTKKTGNSGVLLRVTGPDKVWPRCLEAQLKSGDAGDFWTMEGFPLEPVPGRTEGRRTGKTHDNENAPGEWNTYEIIARGGRVILIVNGEVVNEASGADTALGRIGLQSEGVPIQFRDITIVPLDR